MAAHRSPAPAAGTLHFYWTIDGDTRPSSCQHLDASTFEATVFDAGVVDAQVEFPCEAFEGAVRLYVDTYVARTALVDLRGFPVSDRVGLDEFAIRPNRVTRIEVDFPSEFRGGGGAAGASNP